MIFQKIRVTKFLKLTTDLKTCLASLRSKDMVFRFLAMTFNMESACCVVRPCFTRDSLIKKVGGKNIDVKILNIDTKEKRT